jgi:hypothetical protein
MADQKLPTPATGIEMLTHAVVLELRKLNANIEKLIGAQESAQAGEVTLKEPAKPTTRDARQAADKVAKDAVGPVTVETVETIDPKKTKG